MNSTLDLFTERRGPFRFSTWEPESSTMPRTNSGVHVELQVCDNRPKGDDFESVEIDTWRRGLQSFRDLMILVSYTLRIAGVSWRGVRQILLHIKSLCQAMRINSCQAIANDERIGLIPLNMRLERLRWMRYDNYNYEDDEDHEDEEDEDHEDEDESDQDVDEHLRWISNMSYDNYQDEDEDEDEQERYEDEDDNALPHLTEEESMHDSTYNPVPATKSSIEALEIFILEDGSSASKELCMICMEQLTFTLEVSRMSCSHLYHGDCIVQWLNTSHFCPLCRFPMPSVNP